MVLDPETGITARQVFDYGTNWVLKHKKEIEALKKEIYKYYEDIPEDELDRLETATQYTPDDIRTLARAVAMDYELLTSKELPEDFYDRFNTAVGNFYALRNKLRPKKKEEPNASTINPDDNTASQR